MLLLNGFALEIDDVTNLGNPPGIRLTLGTSDGVKDGTQSQIIL